MERTSYQASNCSIARTLDVIGEPWSPLILRDVYAGTHRFEQLQIATCFKIHGGT